MRRRIFIWLALFVMAFGVLSTLLITGIVNRSAQEQLAEQLGEEARLISEKIGNEPVEPVLTGLVSPHRISWILADGTVSFDNWAKNPDDNHLDRDEVKEALATGEGLSIRYSETVNAQSVYFAKRLSDGSVLRVAAPERLARRISRDISTLVVLGMALLLILSLPVIHLVSNRLLKPILSIDPDRPQDAKVPMELLPLVKRLDHQNRQNQVQLETMAIRQSEREALISGLHEGFVALDAHQDITLINPSACRMLGLTSDEAIGRGFTQIDRSPAVLQMLETLKSTGSAQAVFERAGRVYLASASRLDHQRGSVLLFTDQTEKTRGEAMRKQFTANVSHELRTPMTAIFGYAQMLEQGMVKEEDLGRFYGLIHRESGRMLKLMEDILRLSKLDEGHVSGERSTVDLYALASAALATLRPTAEARGITLSLKGERALVMGDATLLDELCFNLVDNAVKYNNDNGRVDVSVKGGKRPAITVTDTGIGIAPEHQGRVFERFYRTDASRSKQTGGTGLGLSIVKHAAEYHGAQLTLTSEPGRGTNITVTFPQAD